MHDDSLPEFSPRSAIIAVVIVTMAVIGGAIVLLTNTPQPVKITIRPPLPTATAEPPAPITVYVTGAVMQPDQVITIAGGSRVQDVLATVGGVTSQADLSRVNLAARVYDGDQVHVPAYGEVIALATPGGGVKVHINWASLEELDTLPGIGPALGQRIIDYREVHGPFKDLVSLDAVEGIGPALLEKLKDRVAFD